MNDLEKFLQQAAERIKERMREQQGGQRPPPRPAPVRQAERAPPRYDEPEILEADVVDAPPPLQSGRPKRVGSERISNIDQRKPPVSDSVDMADERMSERLHQVFDHSLGLLNINPMTAVNDIAPRSNRDQTNRSSEVQHREQDTSPLIAVLQQPESLKAAFIVGEIFKRKF